MLFVNYNDYDCVRLKLLHSLSVRYDNFFMITIAISWYFHMITILATGNDNLIISDKAINEIK